jgi:hypothetical protein
VGVLGGLSPKKHLHPYTLSREIPMNRRFIQKPVD